MFRIEEVCLVVLHYIAGPSGIAIHLLIKEQKSIQVNTHIASYQDNFA